MDPLSLAAFEERAQAAEARLAVLESRLASGVSTQSPAELTALKDILLKAREETVKLQAERDQAADRAKSLEEENLKLRYQVKHLKRAVEAGDAALAAAAAAKA